MATLRDRTAIMDELEKLNEMLMEEAEREYILILEAT